MGLSLRRTTDNPITSVVFGKLPSRPDFVRISATHPVATEFDELIQSGLEQYRTQECWEERYDFAPVVDFCYPSRDQKWVFTGALLSSHDQSTRRYPFVAGVTFPAQAIGSERRLMPIACELFFEGLREQLSNAIDSSAEAEACRVYLESQTATWSNGTNDLPLASEIVKHFLDGRHPSVLEGVLAPGTLAQALLNISFYRDFLRRFYSSSALQVIEIPLQGGRGEAALHASAWLSILSAISGPAEPWNGGFLLKQGRDSARLYAFYGRMPERAILMAMGGDVHESVRLDLRSEQKTWQAHKLYAETAYALERLVQDPSLTLSALLAFLGKVGQKIAAAGS